MIWLIGYRGMLGSEFARQLKEKNIDFIGTGSELDVSDLSALEEFVFGVKTSGRKIDFIVNCAAYTAVDKAESEIEQAAKVNTTGPKNLATIANFLDATLIHVSTDYVFDGTGNVPYTEDMSIAPIGAYGKTKADGEKTIIATAKKYYIIRTAWLYGWNGKNFVYTMIRAMNMRDSVRVVNDQKGSPTFCGDLADVICKFVKSSAPYGVYHFTDEGEITWWDFTNEIKAQGIKCGLITNEACEVNPCTTDEYPTPAKRPAYSVLCKDKIQKTLGITLPDWKVSLDKFLSSELFDKSRIE